MVSGLKRASVNGVAVSMGSQMVKLGLTFVFQILIARLLSPTDFGLVAMAAPIVILVQLFADFGLSQATVQRPQISQAQLSLLFWINLGVSAALALAIALLAPLVGAFYREPRVIAITALSGALLLVSGLYSQHQAILNRRMAFGKLAAMDLISFGFGSVAALWAAMDGFGYWAILVGQAATSVISMVIAWILSGWRPGWPAKVEEWRSLAGFGANLTGFNLVNYFARNLDRVLIGRFIGDAPLGLYDRAYKLLLLPLNQISQPIARVALPLLSRAHESPETYRRAYLRLLEFTLLMTYPGILFAMATHDQLIRIALGEKWMGVSPIFAILAAGALFAPITNSTGWLFISQNRTAEMRNWGTFSSVVFVASFVAGLPWGPVGVAACYIGVGLIQGPIVWWAACRVGPVSFDALLSSIWPYAAASAACFAVVFALEDALPNGLAALALLFGVAYATFIGTLLILPAGRGVLREAWEQAKPILAWLSPSES